jgi:hypothetical protein
MRFPDLVEVKDGRCERSLWRSQPNKNGRRGSEEPVRMR